MRVQIGETRLFFDVEGAKLRPDGPRMREVPTLLLLHGGPGGDHASFKPEYSQLADVAQIVYLDHRGQGRSDPGSPAQWHLSQWADDVHAFCEALEIRHPIVMGLSFGGFVALAYAVRYPDHPSRLILCCTRGGLPDIELEVATFERLGGKEAGEAARRYLNAPSSDRETLADFVRLCRPLYSRVPFNFDRDSRQLWNVKVLRHFADENRRFNLLPELSKIKCPTLVLGGEDDPATPIRYSEEIVSALRPGLARFERFPNAGHGIAADAPERFFRVVRDFISDPQVGTTSLTVDDKLG